MLESRPLIGSSIHLNRYLDVNQSLKALSREGYPCTHSGVSGTYGMANHLK